MPRGRSRSPNERGFSNRRSNFSPQGKRSGAPTRSIGPFSRSPHRSRSPPPRRNRPSTHHRLRSPRPIIGSDRPPNLNTGGSFVRPARNPVKRSRSPPPSRRRQSLSPQRKQMITRKSSPLRSSKGNVIVGGGKRISVSPSANRRKHSPPTSSARGTSPPRRMDATAGHRETSRLTDSSGHSKRDYGSPKRSGNRSLSPVVMKKEKSRDIGDNNENRNKTSDPYRSVGNTRDRVEVESEFQGDASSLLANGRNFRNENFAPDVNANRGTSPYRDRLEGKRYQDINMEEANYRNEYHKVVERERGGGGMREEKQLLDDRFRTNDEGGRAYNTEELKKITVDIRRNIPRENEAIVRRIINPEDVILVRRPGEGSHPIFDRDEIKQSNLEREEEFLEKRVVAIVRERGRSRSPIQRLAFSQQNEMHENFKVHRDGSFNQDAYQSRPSLSDRWQHDRKFGSSIQNEKLLVSVRPGSPQMQSKSGNYRGDDDELYHEMSGSRGRGNDEESMRYPGRDSDERHRDLYDSRRPVPTNPNDLRHSLISRGRPFEISDARHRILERQDREPAHFKSMDAVLDEKDRGGSYERFRSSSGPYWDRDRMREKWDGNNRAPMDKILPNFAARRDRYQYKEWVDKPDMVPKGPSYFEHDTRGEGNYEFRRGRGYRGFSRGSPFWARGSFRGRGRGVPTQYAPRRDFEVSRPEQVSRLGKRSPNQWEHDMFESAEVKSDQDGRPL